MTSTRLNGLRRAALTLLLWIAAGSGPALAQNPFNHKGFDAPHSTYSPLPGEHIDPASGTLSLVATDLVLPGNAGLDLRVQRVYSSGIYPDYANGGSTALEEDSWAGIGWRLHFGRVINPDSAQSGATQIEMGDGSRHPLYTTSAQPEGWTTPNFWIYNRATNTLKLPSGIVYTFGHSVYLNARLGTVRYVTEIRDPFNNRLTFSYFGAGGPPDGVAQIQQHLSATDVRVVNFTYDATFKALATMTYDGRTWTYEQFGGGPPGFSVLTGVRPPIGPKWTYAYDPQRPGELTTLTTPNGGTISYTYFDIFRRAATLSILSRVVITRVVGGRALTAGTWDFLYGIGPNEDTTKVICPCGITTYRFFGTGLTGDFSAWKAGALAEQTVEQNFQTLERRTFAWRRSEAISPDAVPGQNGVWSDDDVHVALPEQEAVTRGTHTTTTTYEYHTANFNDYGQAWRIHQTGDFTRRVDRSFQHAFVPYIVGRPLSETAWVGTQSIDLGRRTYDANTGFVTSTFDPAAQGRTYEPTAQGNVGAAIDSLGNRTTYTYAWGVVSQARTQENVTTTHAVNPNGTIASTTIGTGGATLTTTITYDAAFRPLTNQPPSLPPPNHTHPIIYAYDNQWGEWTSVSRWDTSTQSNLDGFGRVLNTNTGGLKTRVERDACGRVTFESAPYTSGSGTRGVSTVYDALGRVTRITDALANFTQYAYSGIDVTVTDAEARQTLYDYSAAGDVTRLVSVRDAANELTQYQYDVSEQLLQVTGPGTVPARTWTWDSRYLLLNDTQPESGQTVYEHDLAGLLKKKTDAKNQITEYTYDGDLRTRTVNLSGTADDVTITYDTLGRVASQATAGVSTVFGYDASSRLASRTDTVAGLSVPFVSTYGYDLKDNLTRITYPSGRQVLYEYDTLNRITRVKQKPTGQAESVFADTFAYDDSGRLTSYRTGTVTHTLAYDDADRIQRTTAGGTSLDLTYTYDKVSNVTKIADPRPGMTQDFGYDALNRLTVATGPWGSRSWGYNAAGDRTWENAGGITIYNYHAQTRRLTSTSGLLHESFTYDAVGQLTSDARASNYTYNAQGLVTQLTTPNVTATYTYDAQALRVMRMVNGAARFTIRSGSNQTLSEYESQCGATPWRRDVIYAGGRLLGAISAVVAEPSVSLVTSSTTAAEAQGTVAVQVRLTTSNGQPTTCPVTVSYAQAPTTAQRGADYGLSDGTKTFPSGTASGTTQTISVPIVADTLDEAAETFNVNLSSVVGGTLAGPAGHTITITDDDPTPTLSINDASVTEGSSSTELIFTLLLSAPSGRTITAHHGLSNGTATAGSDYVATSGTLTIPEGIASQTFHVTVIGDPFDEPNEDLFVMLNNVVNATLSDGSGRGVIVDDDTTPGIAAEPARTKAGDAMRFTLRLSNTTNQTVTVQYQTSDGTAVAGTDYTARSGTATFAPNTPTTIVDVFTTLDAPERDETFTLTLSNPSNALLQVASATGTIHHRRKGDLNGDGLPDLLWQHTSGALEAWFMSGAAQIGIATVSATIPSGWEMVGMGDFNSDGLQDLVWEHTNGSISVWLLDNTTVLSGQPTVPGSVADANWRIRGVWDVNLDGRSDLVWQHQTNGQLSAWTMSGLTQLSGVPLNPNQVADTNWRIRGSGFFNAGSAWDLVWMHQTSGALSAWLMNGTTQQTGTSLTPSTVSTVWRLAAVVDLNADGSADLVWQHTTTGETSVWLMNGLVQISGGPLTPSTMGSGWTVVGPK